MQAAGAGWVKSRNRCLIATDHHKDSCNCRDDLLIGAEGGIMKGRKEKEHESRSEDRPSVEKH